MKDFNELTTFLIMLSGEASKIMLKYYSPLGIKFEKKSDFSPVTIADIEINKMVIDLVKHYYNEYEILGEEISTDVCKSNKLFVIDPLDGTQMFAIGAPMFGFSAAVVIDGESVSGIVANPLAHRTLVAQKGKGSYLIESNSKICVSNKNSLEKAIVNYGWMESGISKLLHNSKSFTPEVYSVCEAGSLVALGGFDGMIFLGKSAHDVAAIKIIVEEAGGKVTDLHGNDQLYNNTIFGAIVSNKIIHDDLVNIVKKSKIINTL